ncbi:ISPsy14, transposase [Azospirillum doebereinerae]
MPAKRLSMRRIREMMRLRASATMSDRAIAQQIGVARSTLTDYLERLTAAGLSWPLPENLTDAEIEQRLFSRAGVKSGARRRAEPDWAALVRELRRPGVTLSLLWEEYRQDHGDGYGYSRFCELYREFECRLSPTMRQHHVAGDKLFVDYSGKRLPIVDPATGMLREAELFIAVLGASNYTYAEASWTQTLPDWLGAHVRLFEAIGGVPRLLVPDNLKSGVHKASFYDPEINRSYAKLAAHYGIGVVPARPRRPRDKAKVEAGVRFAQTYILGRLRNRPLFSLAEANTAIREVLERLNDHPMRRVGVSRQDLLRQIEQPALQPLPATPYEFAEWMLARVGQDYHVAIQGFHYSVPHALIREQVDVRVTARTVEIFHRGGRVAAHARQAAGDRHGTDPAHMPGAHRRYAEGTPERVLDEAKAIGPNTEGLITAILAQSRHPEQGTRACLGVLRLFRGANRERAEPVSARALEIGAVGYRSIASILAHKLDRPATPRDGDTTPLLHANIRGSGYFH